MTNILNQAAIDLIKGFEKLELGVYQDQAGIFTIGYGHTYGVTANIQPITEEQAETYLKADLANAERQVINNILVEISDNAYGALVSLVFNCGDTPLTGALGKLLNAGDFEGASDQFLRWDKVHINGVLTISQGLLNRRLAEQK